MASRRSHARHRPCTIHIHFYTATPAQCKAAVSLARRSRARRAGASGAAPRGLDWPWRGREPLRWPLPGRPTASSWLAALGGGPRLSSLTGKKPSGLAGARRARAHKGCSRAGRARVRESVDPRPCRQRAESLTERATGSLRPALTERLVQHIYITIPACGRSRSHTKSRWQGARCAERSEPGSTQSRPPRRRTKRHPAPAGLVRGAEGRSAGSSTWLALGSGPAGHAQPACGVMAAAPRCACAHRRTSGQSRQTTRSSSAPRR
jgi:hypothetical protein